MGCCGGNRTGSSGNQGAVWRHVRPDGTVQDYPAEKHQEAKAAYDKLGGSLTAVSR